MSSHYRRQRTVRSILLIDAGRLIDGPARGRDDPRRAELDAAVALAFVADELGDRRARSPSTTRCAWCCRRSARAARRSCGRSTTSRPTPVDSDFELAFRRAEGPSARSWSSSAICSRRRRRARSSAPCLSSPAGTPSWSRARRTWRWRRSRARRQTASATPARPPPTTCSPREPGPPLRCGRPARVIEAPPEKPPATLVAQYSAREVPRHPLEARRGIPARRPFLDAPLKYTSDHNSAARQNPSDAWNHTGSSGPVAKPSSTPHRTSHGTVPTAISTAGGACAATTSPASGPGWISDFAHRSLAIPPTMMHENSSGRAEVDQAQERGAVARADLRVTRCPADGQCGGRRRCLQAWPSASPAELLRRHASPPPCRRPSASGDRRALGLANLGLLVGTDRQPPDRPRSLRSGDNGAHGEDRHGHSAATRK